MTKDIVIDNHHFDWKAMPCGKIITGNTSKREIFVRLHRKKCDICAKISFKDLMYLNPDPIPNNKMNYIDYKKGSYNTTHFYEIKL